MPKIRFSFDSFVTGGETGSHFGYISSDPLVKHYRFYVDVIICDRVFTFCLFKFCCYV